MKTCGKCSCSYSPSSRHKFCPSCRNIVFKKPCLSCSAKVQRKSNFCHKCEPKNRLLEDGTYKYTWGKGRYENKRGYVIIRNRTHPKAWPPGLVFEHILVMEKKLGRYLLPGENVHHRNGIKNDNRPENLELWTRPQPVGIRVRDAIKWAKKIISEYGDDPLGY